MQQITMQGWGGGGFGPRGAGFLPEVRLAAMPARPAVLGEAHLAGAAPSHSQAPWLGEAAYGPSLGQTGVEWYRRAKAAVAKYDSLLARTNGVANQTERANIVAWLGSPASAGTPAYRYASVVSDLQTDVERFTPPNYGAYAVGRRTDRIVELESFDQQFEARVANAERVYGVLPPPRVERVVVPGAPAPGPDLTVPLLLGGGALLVALLA